MFPTWRFCISLLACLHLNAAASAELPTIQANGGKAVIEVGGKVVTRSWQLSPDEKPDVFTAKLDAGVPQKVRFKTDIDEITFTAEAGGTYDFIVNLNGKPCWTRIAGKAVQRPTQLEISYDYDFANAIASIVDEGTPNAQIAARLAQWPESVDRMVQKMGLARRERFYAYLAQLARDASAITQAKKILARFSSPSSSDFVSRLQSDVARRLSTYLPATTPVHVRVRFVFGGNSSGFAFGGDDVYVNLADFADVPAENLAAVVAHEAFHAIQAHLMPAFPAMVLGEIDGPPSKAALAGAWSKSLLHALVQEGTAELVSRMDGNLSRKDLDLIKKNAARASDIFLLFETLFQRTRHVPPSSPQQYDRLYGLMFYTHFDATAYHMGWMMAHAIEESDGKAAIAALLTKAPQAFFLRYQDIAKKDAKLPTFTDEFIEALSDSVHTEAMAGPAVLNHR